MAEKIFEVNTDVEQVRVFMTWAERFKNDFQLPGMECFSESYLEDVVEWLKDTYREEDGEIIVRPFIYFQLVKETGKGLDCDDQAIFLCALMRFCGTPKDEIYLAEFDDGESSHIFCGVMVQGEILWLDCLPGSVFGVHSYDEKFLKISRMSDYI